MIKDFIYVYKRAVRDTLKNIKFVPALIIVLFVFNIAQMLISRILMTPSQSMNFVMGFARYIIEVAFISALLTVLDDIVNYNRFRFQNIIDGFTSYMGPLFNTLFIIYVVQMIADMLLGGIPYVSTILAIGLLVIRSPLYETIYIANQWGMPGIIDTIDFIKNNILYWIIPMIVFVIVELEFSNYSLLTVFDISFILKAIISGILLAFIYLFKGNLYKVLYSSSRRKREFEGMF